MAVNLSPVGGVAGQFFDNNGDPLVGGKLFTYAAGTTTPQATYTSSSGATPNSNPIILNGGGRVPSEIWLTDGLQYKFVLYTSDDQLIGSWDNILGINSNFVNFTNQQEIQIATAGQTVFTLANAYQPGTNSLSVFVDGVNQYGPGALYSYVETNSTTVTFNAGLHVGAEVKFTTSQLNTSASTADASQVAFTGFKSQSGNVQDLADDDGADWIGYEPAGTSAVAMSVQDKLRETVSVKDFGAVGDGVTDDTAAIQAALDSGAAEVIFDGTFLYTDTITISNSVKIVNKGTLKYGGTYAASNPHFKVTVDNVVFTGGLFDCNNDIGSIIQFDIGTNYGNVNNARFINLESKTALGGVGGDFACVVLKGNYTQVHDCVFEDCINTDPVVTNDSFPRGITITGDYNTVSDVQMQNVRCPILTIGSYNHIKNVWMDTVADNGLYYGGDNNVADGVVMLNMTDEPIVFLGTDNTVKNCVIDNSESDVAMNAISFESASGAILDGLEVRGILKCGSLFRNRTGNTTSTAIIKNVAAKVSGLFGVYAGTEGVMNAEFIGCSIEYVSQSGYDYNFFIRVSSGEVVTQNCSFASSDLSGYTSTNDLFNVGITYTFDTSWIKKGGARFRNFGVQPKFTTYRINSINSLIATPDTEWTQEVLSDQAPTSGTWKRGDVVWNSAPSAGGFIGWVCVTAGTPGTWKTFGAISA